MHHTIQTKFTDQTTGIMKLKPMHVILYQKKKTKIRQHRNEVTSNMCIKIDLHLKL